MIVTRRLRDMPVFWKILAPFMTLMLLVGAFGTFVVVRTLATRAQSELDQELTRRSVEVRATLRDRELSLLEAATLAANVEGMASAIAARDSTAAGRLAESVLALKADLGSVTVVDASGQPLVGLQRVADVIGDAPRIAGDAGELLERALAEATARKHAGLVEGAPAVVIAAPVCTTSPGCEPVGAVLVGVPLDEVVDVPGAADDQQAAAITIHDRSGRPIATSGPVRPDDDALGAPGDPPMRRSREVGGRDIATLYTPYTVGQEAVGRLAVSLPAGPALASARDAAFRLGAVFLAAMAGVAALGAVVSRLIVGQVRPLVDTNRRLGSGDMSARAPVLGDDELGELARGVNAMAEQLQASYETLESRVRQRTEEIQRLLQERTDFFAAISHELRTPLAVIIAQAELMRDGSHRKTAAWTAQAGTAIGDAADQLLSLVNDILDLARAEAGRLVVSPRPIDLAATLDALRPTVEGLARTGQISVSFDVPSPLPVHADPIRVRTVVLNLADNAVKYTPPGGQVTVAADDEGDGMVAVRVSDTGIGVPPEIGERIFEPFYRAPGAETQAGQASSGLGLALARRLVEAQGGTIAYAVAAGGGTTFTFTLPRAEAGLPVSAPAGKRRRRGAE